MNILFPFVGDRIGGSHIATCILIKEFIKTGQHTPLVVLHTKGPLESYLNKNNIPYTLLETGTIVTEGPFTSQAIDMYRNIGPLKTFLEAHKIHIVHTNDLRMHYTWIMPTHLHGNARHVWHQHSQTNSWRLAALSFFTDQAVTISKYAKKSFPMLFRRKTCVLYNPFTITEDNESLESLIRKTLPLKDDQHVIGFIGNLTAQKRPDFFLHTADHLLSQVQNKNDFHFVLIGEKREPLFSQLQQHIHALGLENNIHFLGPKFPIEPYIQDMDVLVSPARREGLGRTIVESMLCGTPVVAANDGGHKELIQHNRTGYLIDPDSVSEFSQTILMLCKNPQKANHIKKEAYGYAKKQFNIDTYYEGMVSLYESLLRH